MPFLLIMGALLCMVVWPCIVVYFILPQSNGRHV